MPHWTVKVCGSSAQSITMQAGPHKSDNNVFATWRPADGQKEIPLPDRIQSFKNIYFKATTPGNDQTDLCVKYDGGTVKGMSFNGGNEDHDINATRPDFCACEGTAAVTLTKLK